jgi:hypothetical protein
MIKGFYLFIFLFLFFQKFSSWLRGNHFHSLRRRISEDGFDRFQFSEFPGILDRVRVLPSPDPAGLVQTEKRKVQEQQQPDEGRARQD